MIIRKEENRDLEDITQVTIAAFKNHPISRQTEHFIMMLTAHRAGLPRNTPVNALRSQRPVPSHQRLI
jgi:hypothetical protein